MKDWLQMIIVAFCLFLLVFFGAIRFHNLTNAEEEKTYLQCEHYKELALVELFYVHDCETFFKKE